MEFISLQSETRVDLMRFYYESKIWGAHPVRLSPFYLGALRLKNCLDNLRAVKGRVLEVGCGGGGMIKAIKLYRPDLEAYGCDISQKEIKIAKQKPEGVKFLLGDVYQLPFADNCFGAVIVFDLLEHLEKPKKALREIYRILKPGGLFHSYTPCEGEITSYPYWFNKLRWEVRKKYAGHIQQFTAKGLEKIVGELGFKKKKKAWSGHLFYQIVDSAYFSFLKLRRRNFPFSLESYVSLSSPNLKTLILAFLLKIIAFISFIESSLLSKVPGLGVHLSFVKK